MQTIESTPQYLTRVVGMTPDEHEMLATALEYTLQQVRYDPKRDRYYLDLSYPKGCINTVMLPEEFNVFENIAFQIIGDAYGRDWNE
jgi:hypothetical protein